MPACWRQSRDRWLPSLNERGNRPNPTQPQRWSLHQTNPHVPPTLTQVWQGGRWVPSRLRARPGSGGMSVPEGLTGQTEH